MKKRLSLLLACMLLSQTMGAAPVNAQEVKDIYADIYGINVKLDTAPNAEGISLTLNGENVGVKIELDGTAAVIKPENGYFETDKIYKLNIEGAEKEFKIKTLYFAKSQVKRHPLQSAFW